MTPRSTALHGSRCRDALFGIAAVLLAVVASLPLSGGSAARADEARIGFKIIVHPANPVGTTTSDALRRAFLKQTTRWADGEAIKAIDLPIGSPIRKEFSRTVLQRSIEAVRSYWLQRIFAGGQTPPLEAPSAELVVRYVAQTRGAVGYVAANVDAAPAKVIELRFDD